MRVSDWASGMGTDRLFPFGWAQLGAAGLVRGAYWYLMLAPGSPSPEAQAQAFVHEVKAAGLTAVDLLVCDSEEEHPGLDEGTLAFCAEVMRLTGHRPEMIPVYSNLSVGSHLVKTSRQFPSFWVAWPNATPPEPAQWAPATWGDWLIWQNGITRQPSTGEQVDADQFNGTAAQLRAFVTGAAAGPVAAIADQEDPMLLSKGAGATTPVALPNGATKIRLFANNSAEVRVDRRDGARPPISSSATTVRTWSMSAGFTPSSCTASTLATGTCRWWWRDDRLRQQRRRLEERAPGYLDAAPAGQPPATAG